MKHADAPDKFMESEVDLDEAVQRLVAVAGSPELYTEIIRLGVVPTLLALLQHENADIAADAIQLFKELTDADALDELEEDAKALVAAIVAANGLELLVQRMAQFNEKLQDDATAVFNTLAIIENLVEVDPQVAELALQRTKLLKWLLGRVKLREFDSNKQYASELLAILLQGSAANQQALVDADGIELLLQAISVFKNRDPGTEDETEHVANLVGAMCSCLLLPATRTVFVAAEGIELMMLILKQKRRVRTGALKALDFALVRCLPACERLVDVQGLRTLFPLFMGKHKLKRPAGEEGEEQEEEEHCVSLITNLLLGLQRGSRRDRVAAKFVENEFEKCDRLMEIYLRLVDRVREEEADVASDEDEEGRQAARMAAGQFTLQQCAIIVASLWSIGDRNMQKRLLQLLHQQSETLGAVREAVAGYVREIDLDALGAEAAEAARQRSHLQALLKDVGYVTPEVPRDIAPSRPALDSRLPNGTTHALQANEGAPAEADPFGLGDMEVDAAPSASGRDLAPAHSPPSATRATDARAADSPVADDPAGPSDRGRDHVEAREPQVGDSAREGKQRTEKDRHKDRHRDKDRDRERDRDRRHHKEHKEHKRRRDEHDSSRKKERHG